MATVYLVSCVGEKAAAACPAAELYTSAWFRKARRHAAGHADRWFVLSAEHGLLDPAAVVAPYERTLNAMPADARRRWAAGVMSQLDAVLAPGDRAVFLAGERYREFLTAPLAGRGVTVTAPMAGLGIGEQLHWLDAAPPGPRRRDVDRLYELLGEFARRSGGPRPLGACRGRDGWPARGVYFFFEPGEYRASGPAAPRVVRVGTHAVGAGARSTVWARLRQHRGSGRTGGGNHRGSIFRLHAGNALLRREAGPAAPATWGRGASAPRAVRDAEHETERRVSAYLGTLEVLCLPVGDEPGPASDRAVIERNAIGLLCGPAGPLDPPSAGWLGRSSDRAEIRASGLWNLNHVGGTYDPIFLSVVESYVTHGPRE